VEQFNVDRKTGHVNSEATAGWPRIVKPDHFPLSQTISSGPKKNKESLLFLMAEKRRKLRRKPQAR